jgi:hypothetical protein
VWRLRRHVISPDVRSYAEQLSRDGFLVVPDFLPADQFERVKAEFDASRETQSGGREHKRINGLVLENRNLSAEAGLFPAVRRYVEENAVVYKIVSSVLKSKIKYTAPVYAEIWRCPDPLAVNEDLENVLHADVHYPTVKLWLYMNEVDETNAAFVYAPGSHKLTFARLRHEYDLSVRQALIKSGRLEEIPHELLDRGRNCISSRYAAAMKLIENPVCGAPNTLVIANNLGFHKRGRFTTTRERATLAMSFRYVASLHHRIYPALYATPRYRNEYEPGRLPVLS